MYAFVLYTFVCFVCDLMCDVVWLCFLVSVVAYVCGHVLLKVCVLCL